MKNILQIISAFPLHVLAMERSKSFVLTLIFTFCAFCQSFATVDYLAVNKITKEIYSFDQEQVRGVFWVTVGDGAEARYLARGYTYTKNPYSLDNLLTLIVFGVTSVALFSLWRKRLIKRSFLIVLFYLHLVFALKYLALYSDTGIFGVSISIVSFIIPVVILLISRMMGNFKSRRYSLALHVVFSIIFSYLLFLQMSIPS